MMTLDDIVRRNAQRFPTRAGIRCGERSWPWAEVDERVNRLAHALTDAGLSRGDRLAVLLPNCPEFVEIYFACARTGIIAVPLNYRLTPQDMIRILEHVAPALWVVCEDFAAVANEAAAGLREPPPFWIVGNGDESKGASYEARLAGAESGAFASPADEHDTLAIFFTSGTTGLPKGAMVTHANLEMNGYNQIIADRAVGSDVNLVATPLYHMGAVFMAVTYMMLGCTQVILPRFEPGAWLAAIAASGATVSLLIPTMINAVVNDAALADTNLSRLRLVFYGGGPMPAAVLGRAIESLRCGFTQGYGLTETLEATFLVAEDHRLDGDEDTERRLASAGREAVGAEVRIVDDAGTDLPANEVGEILIRSRSVIPGYWRNPEETAQAIRDGWFHTGDLGYLDDGRYLFVVDRKKDMVVSGGVNIYTKEIEEVLYRHPAVLEAAVIGTPDEQWGEAVTAVVALKAGKAVTSAELVEHCSTLLAGFKKPRRVVFLPELPKNPSGKILKRELRTRVAPIATATVST